MPAAFQLNGSGYKLVNQFATPEFKAYCEMMKLWNEKGYIRSDSATYSLTADNYTNDLKAGKIGSNQLGFVAPHVKAMAESGWDNKYEAVQVQTGGDWAINSIIQSSLTAVSITSKNPERAVMYYDLVVAKPELYNTILWGVEGVNFTKSSENQIKLIADTGYGNGSQVVPDWACGHQFNGWVLDTQSADIWQQVQAWSEKAKPSPILGFVFSPENVKTELANCSAVVTEQLRLLDTGSIDVATGLAKLLASLETAGSAKILAEAQSQLDVWTAANKK
jgi:putative aldouronate transport system substrate-binding protein